MKLMDTAELFRRGRSSKSEPMKFVVLCLAFSCMYVSLNPRFVTHNRQPVNVERSEKFLVCFHTNHINRRGTEVALFDYAHTLLILGGDRYAVRFIAPKHTYLNAIQHVADVKNKFESTFGPFEVYDELVDGWEAIAPGGHSLWGGPGLANITRNLGCKMLYTLKAGTPDDPPSFPQNMLRIPWAIHAVFNTYEPHGYTFAAVSKFLAKSQGSLERCNGRDDVYVDHIVDLPLVSSCATVRA